MMGMLLALRKMAETPISDAQLDEAEKEAKAVLEIIAALRQASPESRLAIFTAGALLAEATPKRAEGKGRPLEAADFKRAAEVTEARSGAVSDPMIFPRSAFPKKR